ncbi:MAG: hypothetical protein H8E17_09450 [Deltaproteobacteria bacterium]|nr:hypothetical protein [Deltaproteobacteria bacterium]
MHYYELYFRIKHIFRDVIRSSYPVDWDEDFITRTILSRLRRDLGRVEISGAKDKIVLNWMPFKLTGLAETYFGDIAIIVYNRYRDGDEISGVAFLEAKKRDPRKTSFKALNITQLKRIYKNAPHSQVLYYDYEDVTEYSHSINRDEHFLPYFGKERFPYVTECTHSIAAPMQNIIETKLKDTSAYKFGLPFSYQLCFRYFQSFDLDLDKRSFDIARGYAKSRRFPKFVLLIVVSHGDEDQHVSENQIVNTELYQALED